MAEIHDRIPLSTGRFPPPWIVEEHKDACFIVKEASGQALGYFYFEEEPGRHSADVPFKATAVIGCVSSETARSRMTHHVDLLRDFDATQHDRAALIKANKAADCYDIDAAVRSKDIYLQVN